MNIYAIVCLNWNKDEPYILGTFKDPIKATQYLEDYKDIYDDLIIVQTKELG